MADKMEFEKYPELTEVIQWFACNVPVDMFMWSKLLSEINKALALHPSESVGVKRGESVEDTWESFWKPIVSNEDGTINTEQVKKELADFFFVMEQVPKVYCHITGDKMSKLMYRAEDVIRLADDYFNEQLKQAVKDETEDRGAGVTGAAWVKVTDRFPPKPGRYRVKRRYSDAEEQADYHMNMFTNYDGYAVAEWLDESPAAAQSFQNRVGKWMTACFGSEISYDIIERNHRFIEEALELVQSTGCAAHEAHQLVDYVFNREIGEKQQEVGGVMVTLAALCTAWAVDMNEAGETELQRVWGKIDVIRTKQTSKPKHSPLPAAAHSGKEEKEFAEWMLRKNVLPSTSKDKWRFPRSGILYTTSQLYDLYKSSK